MVLALRRLRCKDGEFKINLDYIVRFAASHQTLMGMSLGDSFGTGVFPKESPVFFSLWRHGW